MAWALQLKTGAKLDVIAGKVMSPAASSPAPYGDLANAAFVAAMFKLILGRTATSAETADLVPQARPPRR